MEVCHCTDPQTIKLAYICTSVTVTTGLDKYTCTSTNCMPSYTLLTPTYQVKVVELSSPISELSFPRFVPDCYEYIFAYSNLSDVTSYLPNVISSNQSRGFMCFTVRFGYEFIMLHTCVYVCPTILPCTGIDRRDMRRDV